MKTETTQCFQQRRRVFEDSPASKLVQLGTLRNLLKQKFRIYSKSWLKSEKGSLSLEVHRGSKDKITIYLRLVSTQNNVSKYKAQKEYDYTVLLVYTVVKYNKQLIGPLP